MVKEDKVPHAILFTGPSGCGKTTLARILRSDVGCSDHDFNEVNCADFRGIDMVREMGHRIGLSAFGGATRVHLIDEAHQLTGLAQNALLKMLEDPPDHVYFMLATTNPEKLLKTVQTRCTLFGLKTLREETMVKLLESVAEKEEFNLKDEVREEIVALAEGSARKGLVLLDKIYTLKKKSQQIEALQSFDDTASGIELGRLLFTPNVGWSKVASLLQKLKGVDVEGIRWSVLGYAASVMERSASNATLCARAAVIIEEFQGHFYDSKRAGLVHSCYSVVMNEYT